MTWRIVFWVIAAGIALGAVIALDDDAHRPISPPLTPVQPPYPYGDRQ